jgi:hypothetical protein
MSPLIHAIISSQLNYLSETNGEQHLWLHNYVADTPIPLSGGQRAPGFALLLPRPCGVGPCQPGSPQKGKVSRASAPSRRTIRITTSRSHPKAAAVALCTTSRCHHLAMCPAMPFRFKSAGETDPDEWLARLATTPLTKVSRAHVKLTDVQHEALDPRHPPGGLRQHQQTRSSAVRRAGRSRAADRTICTQTRPASTYPAALGGWGGGLESSS